MTKRKIIIILTTSIFLTFIISMTPIKRFILSQLPQSRETISNISGKEKFSIDKDAIYKVNSSGSIFYGYPFSISDHYIAVKVVAYKNFSELIATKDQKDREDIHYFKKASIRSIEKEENKDIAKLSNGKPDAAKSNKPIESYINNETYQFIEMTDGTRFYAQLKDFEDKFLEKATIILCLAQNSLGKGGEETIRRAPYSQFSVYDHDDIGLWGNLRKDSAAVGKIELFKNDPKTYNCR